ncbi:Disease resistance protein TAO1 [Vitis vinifera]|uniref:Disease resistance protein TAO1 n=1 Tax=Vitis vinifera TaxID=29760 RepID=A0A438IVL2_VITVI|nr:Disease resistance protein TAO1 [Vitis vinifera]
MGSLKHLGLDEIAIRELPSSIGHLTGLDVLCLNDIAIKELLSSIHHLTQLQCLEMRKCKNLTSLPSNFYRLKSLSECFLDGCSNLEVFSKITEDMENLQRLGLIELPIKDLPSSIERLKSLSFLELNNCENLETLPNSIGGCNLMEGSIRSDIRCLFSLRYLTVSDNNIRRKPVDII